MELQEIITKAWQDESFKQDLLANPKTVLERELGVSFPPEMQIFVHEQTPTQLHLILPAGPEA